MKVKTKPVIKDAVQFDGTTASVIPFFQEYDFDQWGPWVKDQIFIMTLEGRFDVAPGDWVIRGLRGEFYSCKPDVFEMTYEPAE